jgi:hypothetical protein
MCFNLNKKLADFAEDKHAGFSTDLRYQMKMVNLSNKVFSHETQVRQGTFLGKIS